MLYQKVLAAVDLLVALTGHQCFADITYTLAPFTVDTGISDPGWSYLGGTITTTGALGPINDGNVGTVITGWNLSFIGPTAGMFTLNSGNSSVSYTSSPANPNDIPDLNATSTALFFPPAMLPMGSMDNDELSFDSNTNNVRAFFLAQDGVTVLNVDDFDNFEFAVSQQFYDPAVGIIIAQVPEPTGFLCLWIAAVCVSCRRVRYARKQ